VAQESVKVIVNDYFTLSGGGSNRIYLNNVEIVSQRNQAVHQLTQGGSYKLLIRDGYGPNPTQEILFTLEFPVEAPVITTHPTNQTLDVGVSLSLSVVATGANLAYQWKKDGNNINGATSSVYTKSNVQTNDAGSYVCVWSQMEEEA
jgi:hypothetical protein